MHKKEKSQSLSEHQGFILRQWKLFLITCGAFIFWCDKGLSQVKDFKQCGGVYIIKDVKSTNTVWNMKNSHKSQDITSVGVNVRPALG